MAQLQLIYDRTIKTKQEKKELKLMIKDAFDHSKQLQDVLEEIKILKEKKKKIEDIILEDFNGELSKLDTLKLDLENDKMLMSDKAITDLMNGTTVEVEDSKGNKYEPIFSVKFKRV